jgi:PD-(D/E)XK nuclease superfamily
MNSLMGLDMSGKFSWSFSKLESFETCAKRYYEYMAAPWEKRIKDGDTDNLKWGNEVHDALRDAIKSKTPLPEYMKPYQVWVDRVLAGPGELFVEQKYGLDSNLSPMPYFAPNFWYRGIADIVRIDNPVALAIDWKTGKPKEGSIQLGLMALCIFQHFANVKVVRTDYVWLQEDPNSEAATTRKVWRREDMPQFVSEVLPRVQKLEWAHKTMTFPPTPGGLCKRYCKVTSCPFHGKGTQQ